MSKGSGGGGVGERQVRTYLAPDSVKLIINLLEHHPHHPPPLKNQRPLLLGDTEKKKKNSNTDDVALAQLCKYCDYYVNACTR